jgi:hypothetical protein
MTTIESSTGSHVTTTSKGFQIRVYEPTPAGFDARHASDRELLHHGLPRRPHAEHEKAAHDAWQRAFARPTRWIIPEFVENPSRSHGPMRTAPGAPKVASLRGVANATSTNWSGAVNFSPKNIPFSWVAGRWNVPQPDAAVSGFSYCSQWVGIDGFSSGDVLQAGTETEVLEILWFKIPIIYTWWEWFPAGEVAIKNLPAAVGDKMYCLICSGSTTTATIYFSNQTQGVSTSFSITAPAGTTLVGDNAEWVVERPTINGNLPSLTDYHEVDFDECIAGGAANNTLLFENLTGATEIDMTGNGNAVLSDATIVDATHLKTVWKKAN